MLKARDDNREIVWGIRRSNAAGPHCNRRKELLGGRKFRRRWKQRLRKDWESL